MNKKLIYVLALLLIWVFSACASAPSSAAQTSSIWQSNVAPSTSSSSVSSQANGFASQSTEPITFSLNSEIMQLIGASNKKLQEYKNGECYAQNIAMGAFEISFYEPYLNIIFSPQGNKTISSYYKQGYGIDTYKCEENPFDDNFIIMWITLRADFDAEKNKFANQDSLKLLFDTNADITYTLLCEQLNQQPELVLIQNAYYNQATPDTMIDGAPRDTGAEIKNAYFDATFNVNGLTADISFIKQDNKYVALSLKLEDKALTEQELRS